MVQSRFEDNQKRRRKTPLRRFIKIAAVVFTLLLLAGGAALVYVITQMNSVTSSAGQELDRGDHSDYRTSQVDISNDSFSILFLGVDDRGEDLSGRTDANILATFNKEEESVKLLSIPRDSLVEIPDRGNDKINHAHAFGGVDKTVETVENLFQLPVDYFLTINFVAFMEIVDAFGGVEVDSPLAFTESDSTDKSTVQIEEGVQTLNGEQALAYSRMRKHDPRGDIGRGERQQEVMAGLLEKGASFRSIIRFDDIMGSLENHMKTNLAFGDIVSMHSYASSQENIETLGLEGSDLTRDGIYYYDLDPSSLEEVSMLLRQHLDLEPTAEE